MGRFYFLLLGLIVSALCFTSCDKNDEDIDDIVEISTDNTVVYDGKTYIMNSNLMMFNDELGVMMANSEEFDGENPVLTVDNIHVTRNVMHKELSLATPAEYADGIVLNLYMQGVVNLQFNIYHNDDYGASGTLDGKEYPDVSVFSSGRYKVWSTGSEVRASIEGVLQNGKSLSINLVVPKDDEMMKINWL